MEDMLSKLFGERVEVFLKDGTWLIKHITATSSQVRPNEGRSAQFEAVARAQELYPGLPVVVVPTHA